jgi:predicted Ser/Thr protein kinase
LDYFKRLVFPDPSKLDMFQKVKYEKELVDLAESLLKRGRFNICFLNDMEKLFDLKFTETTYKFYKQLQHLHMVKYENIPPEILEALPMMMSAIMTEGRSLKDAEQTEKPPLMLTRVEHSCYETHGHY